MKDNKDIEKILLNDTEYENMVKSKIEEEFNQELKAAKNPKTNEITDIKEVPAGKLFTRTATYEVINRVSKTKSYINGIQAEGYLGVQNTDRAKLLSGKSNSFVSGNNYVKFVKVIV